MKSYNSIHDILNRLRDITKKIGTDVVEGDNSNSVNKEGYKYYSCQKKGPKHWMFLYISLPNSLKYVKVLLVTGSDPTYPIKDPKHITQPCPGNWTSIPKRILVKPEHIDSGKYSYEDIKDLIEQCYQNLTIIK